MSNRERLEESGILRPADEYPYTPEEEEAVESLTDQEIDLIINQGRDINEIVDEHEPEIEHIGSNHLVNLPEY
jgi:hypothetical protein